MKTLTLAAALASMMVVSQAHAGPVCTLQANASYVEDAGEIIGIQFSVFIDTGNGGWGGGSGTLYPTPKAASHAVLAIARNVACTPECKRGVVVSDHPQASVPLFSAPLIIYCPVVNITKVTPCIDC
jgi:hypothetical protein